jgi:hypothetical protein
MHRPVVVHSTSPTNSWLGPLLQCLYTCAPFREAVLGFDFDHTKHEGAESLYQDYWKGASTWEVPSTGDKIRDTVARAYGSLLALQRLFAFIALTRRRIVAPTDVEVAFGLVQAPDSPQVLKEAPESIDGARMRYRSSVSLKYIPQSS